MIFEQVYSPIDEVGEQVESSSSAAQDAAKMTIEELDLPTRIVNALRNGGIETVGDLLSLDIGLIYQGYVSDSARTWAIGQVSEEAVELMEVTRRALYIGMAQIKPGHRIGDLSSAIQNYVETQGFSVVRDFVGHGIGREMHEDPQVPNFGKAGRGPRLEAGMVLALEPMVTAGSWEVDILEDAWTVVTRDRQLAAHYEDTIALTESGPENLTGSQVYEESTLDQLRVA